MSNRKASEIIYDLERRIAFLEARNKKAMVRSASLQKTAGEAYLLGEGLTKRKILSGEASMLYKIDRGKNQSKYYEMLISSTRDQYGLPKFQLKKQWGRLGPKGRNKVELFDTLEMAKRALAITEANKKRGGYISTYSSEHRSLAGKLKQGQYPMGLSDRAGPWKNQDVSSHTHLLRRLNKKIISTLEALEEEIMPHKILRSLEGVWESTSELEGSLARQIQKRLRPPMERLRGTNKRFVRCPKKTVKELKTLSNYLTTQLSVVG